MLLDEPFAASTPRSKFRGRRRLTNRGIGVLITDHNVRETWTSRRSYIIYSGQVLMGAARTIS
jgi:lipopolysaccharide export system ATP-binding protein